MADYFGIVGGLFVALLFGWHAVDGIRGNTVSLPGRWFAGERFEFFKEFDPGMYVAIITFNLVMCGALLWAVASALTDA